MLVYEVSDDINHITMHLEFAEMTVGKTDIFCFSITFFEQGYLT